MGPRERDGNASETEMLFVNVDTELLTLLHPKKGELVDQSSTLWSIIEVSQVDCMVGIK